MENQSIRNYAQKHGVKLWEIAEAIGMTDSTFSRKLRLELPSDQQDHICRVIEQIAERKAERKEENF